NESSRLLTSLFSVLGVVLICLLIVSCLKLQRNLIFKCEPMKLRKRSIMRIQTCSQTDLRLPPCRAADSSRTQCMHRSKSPSQKPTQHTLLTAQRSPTHK
ncbi:hypothetical protein ATANTOWER_026809, partial [Ataeniobius toweri]|nr:hypothetical protein [Ataeniobius toweri]